MANDGRIAPPHAAAAPAAGRRILPARSPDTDWFWRRDGDRLRLRRRDGRLRHPAETPRLDEGDEEVEVSGRGVVVAVTVVPDDGPGLAGPYCVAVVALAEDPRVRLTTNVIGCPPGDVHVGMNVRSVIEHVGGVALPLFEPDDATAASPTAVPLPTPPSLAPPVQRASARYEQSSIVSGVGLSEVGRRLLRPPITLAAEAVDRALTDAGLTRDEIDGVCTYPGGNAPGGLGEGGIAALVNGLGLRPVYHNGGMEQPGPIGAVVNAMLAVHAGLCRHVLCVRTVWEASHRHFAARGELGVEPPAEAHGDLAWRLPFGATRPASWLALNASLYEATYGPIRETLGRIAVSSRRNAALNPAAVYREEITMDDYFNARMISSPFGLYDCDVPCDGAIAVVVSAREAAADLPGPAIRIEAAGTWIGETVSWDQSTLTHEPQVLGPAAHLWTRTDLTPADVDVAELYDGFTFNCLSWLEALRFCGLGEGIDFVGDGSRIALDGELPVNTHGGQLSAGRLHGFGGLHEAVVQLRGAAGARQVTGAEVAVVSSGGGTPGGCLLLTR